MIIKIIDSYFKTDLNSDKASETVRNLLEDYIKGNSEFDYEHFIELLEESDFESINESEIVDLEYTQDDIDDIEEDILDNDLDLKELNSEEFDGIYEDDSLDEEDEEEY